MSASKARDATAAGALRMSDRSMSMWVVAVSVSSATASLSAETVALALAPRSRRRSFLTGAVPRTSRSSWAVANPDSRALRWYGL